MLQINFADIAGFVLAGDVDGLETLASDDANDSDDEQKGKVDG